MPDPIDHLFWDSCVFYAYLSNLTETYNIPSIEQYLQETKASGARVKKSKRINLVLSIYEMMRDRDDAERAEKALKG